MSALFSRCYGIDTGLHSGEWNMEFDRCLMQAFLDGRFQRRFGGNSCLWRFYGWDPHAVTIGYNQNIASIDTARCLQAGIDVVRRPTGGRAVFHAEEFTYSFYAETTEQNASLYRTVHEIIMLALRELDVQSEFCRSTLHEIGVKGMPTCFTASARYELQVNGRKLVGSAQRRTHDVLLQHGSIPFTGKHKELARLIACEGGLTEKATEEEMERKTVSLQEVLGYIPGYGTFVELMREAVWLHSGVNMLMLECDELEALLWRALRKHDATL